MSALLVLGFVWALPTTLIGLLAAVVLGARPYKLRPAGAWYWVPAWGFWKWWYRPNSPWAAITFGFITICSMDWADDTTVIRHERCHLLQACILGPIFLPVYLLMWVGELIKNHGNQDAAYRSIPLEVAAYQHQAMVDRWG